MSAAPPLGGSSVLASGRWIPVLGDAERLRLRVLVMESLVARKEVHADDLITTADSIMAWIDGL